jgi:Holliday junction resolvase
MGNSLYKQGRRKEYYICSQLKELGFNIVFRSAGSHSCIDIVAIDTTTKVIKLIQCKRTIKENMNYVNEQLKDKLINENKYINGLYNVVFDVM